MGVKGIGGIFFRSKDPDALTQWYRTHLNVGPGCAADPSVTVDEWTWQTQGGPVVFTPCAVDAEHFPADRQWMLNLRVDGIDALIATLRDAGIAVETKPEWDQPGVGRFARLRDPEGNAIELWQAPE